MFFAVASVYYTGEYEELQSCGLGEKGWEGGSWKKGIKSREKYPAKREESGTKARKEDQK